MPDGKSLSKKAVDSVLAEAGGRRRKSGDAAIAVADGDGGDGRATRVEDAIPVAPEAPAGSAPSAGTPPTGRRRVNPGKVERVARLLGLADNDEDEILARLIDEFLALRGDGTTA